MTITTVTRQELTAHAGSVGAIDGRLDTMSPVAEDIVVTRAASGNSRPMLRTRGRSERIVGYRLLRQGPMTQAALVDVTGLSRPTVAGALERLVEDGLAEVDAAPQLPGGAGRRPLVFGLTTRAGVAIGVEVGRRHIQIVVAAGAHRQLVHLPPTALTVSADSEPSAVLDEVVQLIRRVHAMAGADLPILGIGLGLPTPVTLAGRIGSDTFLPAWRQIDPSRELAAQLDQIPLHVTNEASLGALGEYTFGAGGCRRDLTYVKLGTGIGAGIVIGGRLHLGAGGTAGELGHVTVDYRGERCPCGNRGCVEVYAGGKALIRNARDAGLDVDSVPDLVQRAHEGNPACIRIIYEAATVIGAAVGTVIQLNSPELLVLGGSLAAARELLSVPLELALRQTAMPPAVDAVTIEFAHRGATASAWGGVALAIDRFTTDSAN
jgi:predicted NBD/HSP70 family sugar kinase